MDTLHPLQDLLLTAFLALACVWLMVDIVRKLRPSSSSGPERGLRDSLPPAPVNSSAGPAFASAPIASAEPPAPSEELVVSDDISPKHLAVIAASIHHLFAGRARLVSVEPDPAHASWAREGRRDIFTSHRVR